MIKNSTYRLAELSAHAEFPEELNGEKILRDLEKIARLCYKSENRIGEGTHIRMLRSLIDKGHEAMIEHAKITVKIVCDRGVSHEWVRHRIASYAQESTRYCDYSRGKFGSGITVIKPLGIDIPGEETIWRQAMEDANKHYQAMRKIGSPPDRARSVLPISLKTEIYATFNMREWRHFFKLRTPLKAHPHIRFIARGLLDTFKESIPVLFDDLEYLTEKE